MGYLNRKEYDAKFSRCGHKNLFVDWSYLTGEGLHSCNACSVFHSARFKREPDENGEIVRHDTEYPIDGSLVMAVRAYHTEKKWYRDTPYGELPEDGAILWETSITPDMTVDDIRAFMFSVNNPIYDPKNCGIDYEEASGSNTADIAACAAKYVYRNLFYKENSGYKQLYYNGSAFRFGKNANGNICFVMEEAVIDIVDSGGYGVIMMHTVPDEDGKIDEIFGEYFKEALSPEEALNMWNRHISNNVNINTSYLTVCHGEKNELVCLKGTITEITSWDYSQGNIYI